MLRHLLIFIAALALAVPGVVSVVTNASSAPASPPASEFPASLGAPAPTPTIVPTVSPSPGDTTPPVTTATGAGSRWRNGAATVKFAATDADSGVAATVYRVGDGDWVVGTSVVIRAPKDHDNDGEHDQHLPPGQGTLDWPPLLAALRTLSDRTVFCLELGGSADPWSAVRAARRFVTDGLR